MKIHVMMKDPDTMPDAVDNAFKRLERPDGVSADEWTSICEARADAAKEAIADRWMRYSEYLDVEFDLDAGTATVLPASD